jgi:hypothetical protein
MNIKWNKVTWYSKAGAVILFLIVVPAITFKIGREFESTIQVTNLSVPEEISYVARNNQQTNSNVAAISNASLSGISGMVTLQEKPYSTSLLIKNSTGKVVTETVSGKNGKFLITLNPGKYTIGPAKSSTLKTKMFSVIVSEGTFTKTEMAF